MPTSKKRVNLTLDPAFYQQLKTLRRLRNVPISSIVVDLAKSALELQEDIYFAKIAEARVKEPVISHKAIWSKK